MNQTDQEQIESLKLFWGRWGSTIIFSVILLAILTIGSQIWNNQQRQAKEIPSDIYQPIVSVIAKQQALTDAEKAQVEDIANQLKTDHADSAYAHFAALEVAKLAVAAKDYSKALQEFDFILANTQQPLVKDIVIIRKARVLSANGDHQAALDLVKDYQSESQAGQFAELAGDFSYQLGKHDAALSYYQQAAKVYENKMFDHRLLKQKMDDLAKAE